VATMQSTLSDAEKIAKATKALSSYMAVTGLSRTDALNEMISQISGIGMEKATALNLFRDNMTPKKLSDRLDSKGGTPTSAKLSEVVSEAAGAVPPIVVSDNRATTTNIKSDTTVMGETVAPARDATVYTMP
jgi:hypothetical protein